METIESIEECIGLACELEAGTFKPGNISPEYSDGNTTYSDFIESGKAISRVMASAAGRELGDVVLDSVKASMAAQSGGNTHLGTIILFAPIAKSYCTGIGLDGLRRGVASIINAAGAGDSAGFCEAIRLADPGGLTPVNDFDVRAADTLSRIESESVSLKNWMAFGKDENLIAMEYATDYDITFGFTAPRLVSKCLETDDMILSIQHVFIELLSNYLDTLIVGKRGRQVAEEVQEKAELLLKSEITDAKLRDLHRYLVSNNANPGTTADLVAAGLFVCLLTSSEFYGMALETERDGIGRA